MRIEEKHRIAVGLGAGGHAALLIEILRDRGDCELRGLLDADPDGARLRALGAPVLGDDSVLPELPGLGVTHFFVGRGGTGDNGDRRRLFELGTGCGLEPLSLVAASAVVSASAEVGRGAAILPAAVVNPRARLGANVLINTAAVVEHHGQVDDHAHVATGARLAGGVAVGCGAHVGIGAVVREGVKIGPGALVAAGAVVVADVPPGAVVAGVPARPLEVRRP